MRQLQIAIALAPNVLLQKVFPYRTLEKTFALGKIQIDFGQTLGCKKSIFKNLAQPKRFLNGDYIRLVSAVLSNVMSLYFF